MFEASLLPLDPSGKVIPKQWVAELPARYPRLNVADFDAVSGDLAAAHRLLVQQLASGRLANPALPPAVVERLNQEVDRLIPPTSAADRARAAFLKNGLAATSDAWLLWEIADALSAPARARAAAGPERRRKSPGLDSLIMIEARRTGKRIATLDAYPEMLEVLSRELNRDHLLESNLLHLIDGSLIDLLRARGYVISRLTSD